MKYVAFTTLLVIAALVSAAWPSGSQAGPGGQSGRVVENANVVAGAPDTAPNEITVRFKPSVSTAAMRATATRAGAKVLETRWRSNVIRLEAGSAEQAGRLIQALRRNPLVAEAGPSRNATIISQPNDPMFSYQWHMRSAAGGSWTDTAWDMATNHGAGVTVAVIDTGVAYESHNDTLMGYPQTFVQAPDLAGATFVAPWDFANNDGHANDDHGHGTHVAGTIAQSTNNGYGMAGVAYEATIMPVKAMDFVGDGTEAGVIEAIYYAVDNGADVINMSLGFPGSGLPDGNGDVCTEIVGLNAALQYAYDHDVAIVAAAGNDGGSEPLCPAAYPTVISVAATRYDGGISSYSNTGADISAPGGEPTLDQNGDGYVDGVLQETFCYSGYLLLLLDWYDSFCNVFNSGTSMASPHVAGAVALLMGEDPSLTVDQVRNLLYTTARDNGAPGFDPTFGWGNLDTAAAVGSLLGVPVPQPTPVPGLEPPTNMTATAVSTSRIDLTWTDNATNEAGYKLERSADGVNFTLIATLGANVASYSNINLAAGATYYYRVKAYNGADSSAYAEPVSATTFPPPAAPSNLTATAISSSKIQLNWVDNSTNEAGFRLERSTNGGSFLLVTTLAANVTSYTNSFLTADTTYTYRIRAYEGVNYSAYSNTATATTEPPPAAPSNLTATGVSASQIDLTWTDNTTYETAFRLERSTDGVSFALLATLPADTTAYSNINLTADTTYYYRIRAYDGTTYSAYSNTASATTQPPAQGPAAPSNLTATALSSSKIQVDWVDNSTNETGFRLERSMNGGSFLILATLGANVTTYTNANLVADTTYAYRIRAYEGTNYSAYSNTATATTQPPPAAPSNLTATALSTSRIDLTWTDNANNEAGFRLERSTDGVNFALLATLAADTTSYSNMFLSADTTYTYRIRAYDGSNYSVYSNTASATTYPIPAAPSDLTATAKPGRKVSLSWSDNSWNETGFKIERSTDGVNFVYFAAVKANTTTYTSLNLTAGVTYHYRVRAYEGLNHSDYSNVASATAFQ